MKEIHWSDKIAEKLIELNPNKRCFVLAAGITPSGKVHIGNFRDIITCEFVYRALKERGFDTKIIFSWDDYDRFRKIPEDIPSSFSKYLGMPISEIPDPFNCHISYAKHFTTELEEAIPLFGIKLEFISQTAMYKSNKYYHGIKKALQERKKIAKILGEFRTQGISKEELESYYPLQVYCRKCNRSTTTKIIEYDGENLVTYSCECGHKEVADISKENIGKLSWKVDWPMRWAFEKVDFEPGGWDHSAPGGSYDVSKRIAKEVYGIDAPYYQGYAFVGIEGASKMSSSKGIGFTPKELLKIYEPELIRWLFSRVNPEKALTLYFNSEIIRQYDEFDREIEAYNENKLSEKEKRAIELAMIKENSIKEKKGMSFRQIASFGQIVQGNFEELKKMYERIREEYDEETLKRRFEKSQNWIEEFAPELKIKLRKTFNKNYYEKLSEEEKGHIKKLLNEMDNYWSLDKLTWLVYEIPKKPEFSEEEKKTAQRNFFKNVYNMLIGQDTGPRLPTFLIALGKDKVKKLLDDRRISKKFNGNN